MISRNSSDPIIKKNYKDYCKILSEVIMMEKKQYYNNLLIHSQNKQKTTWNIIKKSHKQQYEKQHQ
jgi:hypothetical protein